MEFGFIGWIVVSIVAGFLAEKIMGRNHGLITNLIVGIVGALIGGFLSSNVFGFNAGTSWIWGIVIATAGAVILLFLLGLIKKKA